MDAMPEARLGVMHERLGTADPALHVPAGGVCLTPRSSDRKDQWCRVGDEPTVSGEYLVAGQQPRLPR